VREPEANVSLVYPTNSKEEGMKWMADMKAKFAAA
jgi:hypothetical protein